MRYFPMFLDMTDRVALIAGGGETAAQKARLLARTEARIILMAEALAPELAALAASGRAAHVASDFDPAALAAADFVFVAIEEEAQAARLAEAARAGGALVNAVDRPALCDMITPALVDRDPLVVAIGTEGAAPLTAARLRARLEAELSPKLGPFLVMARGFREAAEAIPAGDPRRRFWDEALNGAPWALWRAGDEAGARTAIETALKMDGGAAPTPIALIPLPDAPDLLTLRALERLQGAETIFHPEGVNSGFLELARRDAARVSFREAPDPSALGEAVERGPVAVLVANGSIPPTDGLTVERLPG